MWVRTLALAAVVAICANAAAQDTSEAIRQIEQILNTEQQRQEQEREAIEQQQRTHTVIPAKPPAEHEFSEDDEQACFDVSEISIDGISLLSEKRVEAVVGRYRGKCLGIADINGIISKITGAYIGAGYVTSRAYIPPQNLRSGTLVIKVIEGFVEDVRIEGGPDRLAMTAWPGIVGQPLNLREIEQGLDQLNRLSTAQATIEFVPGEKVGGSVVQVHYAKRGWLGLTVGRNNSGQPGTGEQQMRAGLEFNSPTGLSDHLYLSLQADTKDDYQGKKSESIGLTYTFPFGYWTFSLGHNQFEYLNRIAGSNTSFLSRGTSQSTRLTARRVFYRDKNQKIAATALAKHQKSDNFIEDVRLENSSVDYLAGEIGIDYEHYLDNRKTLISSFAISQSLGGDASEAQRAIYSEDFRKVNFDLTLSGSFRWLQGSWRWSSGAHGQYAEGDLFSPETLSIGSQYTVRGFKSQGLSDASGAYWRNDLSATYYPLEHNPRFYVAPFMGVDAGAVDEGGSLSGWATGLRAGGRYLRAELLYGQPLTAPDDFDDNENVVHFSLSASFAW